MPLDQRRPGGLADAVRPPRWPSLDAFRGLAIVFMLVDHVAAWSPLPDLLRMLPGRLAMPMFFLLAGFLARTPRWRTAGIAVAGIALPFAVPWIDNPNVLVLWAVGVVVLWGSRRAGLPMWVLAAVGLTFGANGYVGAGHYYEPPMMLGLMALGAMMQRSDFGACMTFFPVGLQRLLAWVGRRPVLWYLGHLVALQALLIGVGLQ